MYHFAIRVDSVSVVGQLFWQTTNLRRCMPPQCKVYKVKSGDTCGSIAHAHGLDITTFYDHNPGIDDPSCKNLEAGTNACLDQPHGSNFPSPAFDPPSSSTTAHSSLPQGTVAPSSHCPKLYTVRPGDTCFEVEAKFGISDQSFHAWNPKLTANCSNLVLGNAYCIQPPQNGTNSTSGSNDTGVALGEVMAGSECTNLYKVQTGDNCTFIEHKFNITNKQFHAVNPNVYQNCTNLLAGVDYCVQPLNMTSTSPSSTSSKSIASHTRSSTSSSRA